MTSVSLSLSLSFEESRPVGNSGSSMSWLRSASVLVGHEVCGRRRRRRRIFNGRTQSSRSSTSSACWMLHDVGEKRRTLPSSLRSTWSWLWRYDGRGNSHGRWFHRNIFSSRGCLECRRSSLFIRWDGHIEQAIAKSGHVSECAVVGVKDAVQG